MKKRFFRVYWHSNITQFGKYENTNNIDRKVGDNVENVYATPHAWCAANMVAWHNDKVYEYEGGHISESVIIVIESDDYYRPEKNHLYNPTTDTDEVIIRSGRVVEKYGVGKIDGKFVSGFQAYQNFANKYSTSIQGKYVQFHPENKN